MNIGKKIHDRRAELGLTLEQVGDYCGVSKATVLKWETGAIRNMRRDKLAQLARVLRMNPADLIDGPSTASTDMVTTYDESIILQIYRQLNPTGQALMLKNAHSLLEEPSLRKEGSTASAV